MCDDKDGARTVSILGLGGSMRYRDGAADMYTEEEMRRRIAGLRKTVLKDLAARRLSGRRDIDILLTHAPARGYGDLDDLPHMGFECFNGLLERQKPILHVYGHVHREYGSFVRSMTHPSGATLINASGYYIYEI